MHLSATEEKILLKILTLECLLSNMKTQRKFTLTQIFHIIYIKMVLNQNGMAQCYKIFNLTSQNFIHNTILILPLINLQLT